MQVRLQPPAAGHYTARLEILGTAAAGPAAGGAALDLVGSAVADAHLAYVDQSTWVGDFGGVPMSQTSGNKTLMVKNDGGVDSGPITSVLAGANASAFLIQPSSTCNGLASLAAGATCSVVLAFHPTGSGPLVGSVHASATGTGSFNTPPTLTVTGTGLAANGLFIMPTPLDLGSTPAGSTTASQGLVFHNNSGASVTITDVSTSSGSFVLGGPGAGACSNGLVVSGAGGTCTLSVAFSPSAGASPGQSGGSVTVTTSGGSASAALSGRVKTPALMSLSSFGLGGGLGAVIVGTRSAVRTFTATNLGEVSSAPLTVSFVGHGPVSAVTDFSLGSITCTAATVAIGASCTVAVSVQPTALGERDAAISLSAPGLLVRGEGDPGNPLPISAIGVLQPQIVLDSSETGASPLDFGSVAVGAERPLWVSVRNVANALTVAGLTISLTNTTDFSLDARPASPPALPATKTCLDALDDGGGLAGGEACLLRVWFRPRATGPANANLNLSPSVGVALNLNLTGQGTP